MGSHERMKLQHITDCVLSAPQSENIKVKPYQDSETDVTMIPTKMIWLSKKRHSTVSRYKLRG